MKRSTSLMAISFLSWFVGTDVRAAQMTEFSACNIVSLEAAQRFIGDSGKVDKFEDFVTRTNESGAYETRCTYLAEQATPEQTKVAMRMLDLWLCFSPSVEVAQRRYDDFVGAYSKVIKDPDPSYRLGELGTVDFTIDRIFLAESVPDPTSDYKAATILFVREKVAGSVTTLMSPEMSLEKAKAVLKYTLGKLP